MEGQTLSCRRGALIRWLACHKHCWHPKSWSITIAPSCEPFPIHAPFFCAPVDVTSQVYSYYVSKFDHCSMHWHAQMLCFMTTSGWLCPQHRTTCSSNVMDQVRAWECWATVAFEGHQSLRFAGLVPRFWWVWLYQNGMNIRTWTDQHCLDFFPDQEDCQALTHCPN